MVRRAQYLHVHCVTDGPAVVPAYQVGALYIAMVLRLVKRRLREDTVSLSNMANLDQGWYQESGDRLGHVGRRGGESHG